MGIFAEIKSHKHAYSVSLVPYFKQYKYTELRRTFQNPVSILKEWSVLLVSFG